MGGYEASVRFYGETLGNSMFKGVLRAAAGLKQSSPFPRQHPLVTKSGFRPARSFLSRKI